MRTLFILLLTTGWLNAKGERPGAFAYYVLSLSWSPNWCALEGSARQSPQCDTDAGYGWVLHGLWPQFETGWPSFCPSTQRDPSRAQTAAMADIMGAPGAAWYQWKKHGRCAGLSSAEFFEMARRGYEAVSRPLVFRRLTRPVKLPARVVEQAFLKANPDLGADMITVTCKANRIQEVRICLTKDLVPRACGPDVRRDCQMSDALFAPIN